MNNIAEFEKLKQLCNEHKVSYGLLKTYLQCNPELTAQQVFDHFNTPAKGKKAKKK